MSVLLLMIYQPPKYNSEFICDFADLQSNICIDYTKVIISGDFNIHIDNSTASTMVCFNELLLSFYLTQHVMEPTHKHNHILDFIIPKGNDNRVSALNDVALLDHYCVFFHALLAADRAMTSSHVKKWYFCKTSLQSFQTHFNSLLLDNINNAVPLRSKKKSPTIVKPHGEMPRSYSYSKEIAKKLRGGGENQHCKLSRTFSKISSETTT